jgi:hypothetical protein
MKMPKKVASTKNIQESLAQTPLPNPNRCQFETSDGRRCRMLRHNGHPAFCLFHAHDEMQLLESERLGSEIASSITGEFMTSTDINFVLGKLFTALAQNRIPPRNAAVLAYIGQLMLHSVPSVKKEYPFVYEYETWNRMLAKATPLSRPTPVPAPVASAPAAPVTKPPVATVTLAPNSPNASVLNPPGTPEQS